MKHYKIYICEYIINYSKCELHYSKCELQYRCGSHYKRYEDSNFLIFRISFLPVDDVSELYYGPYRLIYN